MSIKLGSTTIGSLYLGSTKIGAAYLGGTKIYESSVVDPCNPLGLPPYTIRLEMQSSWVAPSWSNNWTQVSSSPNVWDYTKTSSQTDWSWKFIENEYPIVSVLGFNSTGITNFSALFRYTSTLTSICLFDTSAGTDLSQMCAGTSITSIPLYNTSSATNMMLMFSDCTQVASGALALYTQASTQTTPPSNHYHCFTNCGSASQTGAAELAQISQDWGGTAGAVQTCPNCNGTGHEPYLQCPTCCGSGEVGGGGDSVPCDGCGGTGMISTWYGCDVCGGSGTDPETGDPCPNCGGAGGYDEYTPCPSCEGSGMMPGGETQTCPDCGGSGQIADNTTLTCTSCGGMGAWTNPCPVCNGEGIDYNNPETCSMCNGSGIAPDGESTCPDCGGSGSIYGPCNNCGGTGFESFTCSSCDGTGSCTYRGDTCSRCGGTGQISA